VQKFEDEPRCAALVASGTKYFGGTASRWFRSPARYSSLTPGHFLGMIGSQFRTQVNPPKPNIIETIASLRNLGVALKIISGDNHLVAANVSQQMGLANKDSSLGCTSVS
jgi:hypothetical protein